MAAERISVFDILKIGVGPSSSHTIGPWLAARRFVRDLTPTQRSNVQHLRVDLHGSLAKTGRGHGTDIAVQLGLYGHDPETFDVDSVGECLKSIEQSGEIRLLGQHEVAFVPREDIVFRIDVQLPFHPNSMQLTATFWDGSQQEAVFYSLGGGFILKEGETQSSSSQSLPYPIDTAADLLAHCETQ